MTLFHKQVFQKMNLDVDVRRLQPGEYRRLNNGIPVKGTLDAGQDGNILNIVGNTVLTNGYLPGGTNTTIGFLEDFVGQRAFFFVHNTTASNNSIYQYKDGVITLVFRSALLGFSASDFVDADIIGDILIFTNNVSEIFKIDVAKAIAGGTYTPTSEEITVIKRPPQLPLTIALDNDSGFSNNFVYRLFFTFVYRYIYEDNDESVFSPPSYMQVRDSTKNRIAFELPASETVPATVKQIDFAVTVNGSTELVIFKTVIVSGGTKPAVDYFYQITGVTVPDSVVTKWNDSVPNKCKSLRIFKNRLFTFNNTEGYASSSDPVTGFTCAVANDVASDQFPFKNRGIYYVGIKFFDNYGRHAGVRLSQTKVLTIPERAATTIGSGQFKTIEWDLSSVGLSDIPDWATHYSIMLTKCLNISFFIQSLTRDIFYFKNLADGTISYNQTFSENNNGCAIDISALTEFNIGYTFNAGDRIVIYITGTTVKDFEIRSQDGRFIYVDNFNLSLSVAVNLKYFEIYTPKTPATQESFFEAIEYGNSTGSSGLYSGLSVSATVGTQSARFAITNPGTGSKAFSRTTGRLCGDVYQSTAYEDRLFDYTYSGAHSATAPYTNIGDKTTFSNVFSMNPYSKYFNVWARPLGFRADVVNLVSPREVNKYYGLRFSQVYVQNSLIFGLNTFEALDDYALPLKNGPGTRLVDDKQVLIAIHEVESGSIYIGDGFVKSTDGTQFLAKTDNVVGDDRTYMDSHGTTFPKSIAVHNGRVYYPDINKGHIIRRSQDGLTRISNYGVRGLVGDLCRQTQESIALGHSPIIVGGWDSQYDCYTITFKIPSSSYTNGITLYFHEDSNSWVCTASFAPELYGSFKKRQIHFLAGDFWLQNKNSLNTGYNNWFGVQYTRSFQWEVGSDSLEKIWESIEIDIETLYASTGVNELVVSLYDTNGGTLQTTINYLDFTLRGSAYRSSFFRWINDVNFATTTESKYKSPHSVRGQSCFLNLTYNGTDRGPMKSITVGYRPSLQSNT